MGMTRVSGYVFDGSAPRWENHAAAMVQQAVAAGAPQSLNGSFSAVIDGAEGTDDPITLVTDRIGSRPVYYARGSDGWVAGHDFWQVAGGAGRLQPDTSAAAELLAFNFVLGARTLLDGVFEAPAASIVRLGAGDPEIRLYWPARPTVAKAGFSPREAAAELGEILQRVADRTAALARSRTSESIGLALSGGRDSRVVGWMLRSRGVELECFTTTALGEASDTVHTVAAALGSSLRLLQPWYACGSEPTEEMVRSVCPTTMYGVANHTLTLATDARARALPLHIAGHLGDMPAGNYIDARSLVAARRGADRAVDLVWAKHGRVGLDQIDAIAGAGASGGVLDRLRGVLDTGHGVLADERRFILDQRQRRFILRDYTASQHLGTTFMPLMDSEWLDFWNRVPSRWLTGTALYERAVADHVLVGEWKGLAQLPANGRPIGAFTNRHSSTVIATDFVKKARRQVALRTGRADAVLSQQEPWDEVARDAAEVIDVDAAERLWPRLGWDGQRSVLTIGRFVREWNAAR